MITTTDIATATTMGTVMEKKMMVMATVMITERKMDTGMLTIMAMGTETMQDFRNRRRNRRNKY